MRARSVTTRSREAARTPCGWPASGHTAAGINLCGSVHDALVIEAPLDRIEADVALTQEIMRRAARVVLGSTDPRCELRTDATVVR
jgi:DNA polymerase-1